MIEGKLVNLEAVEGDFAEKLKGWILTPAWAAAAFDERREPWLPQKVEKLIEKWDKDEKRKVFGIRTRGDHPQSIGIAGFFKGWFHNRTHGSGLIFFIAEEADAAGSEAADAMRLVLSLLFDTQNVNRVEFQVPAYDEARLLLARGCGFVEEGRFRESVYADGAAHDLVQLGLLRSEWGGYDAPVTPQPGEEA